MALGASLVGALVATLCTNHESVMNGTQPGGDHVACDLWTPRLLEGKQYTIAALNEYPLSYMENDQPKGIVFDLVDILKNKYGFNYTVKMAKENIVGDESTGIVGMLKRGEADMAAAFLPVFHDMDHLLNFSTSLDESNWVVLMKRPSESATGSGLLAPFDSNVWILILISLIAIGPSIYLILILRAWMCKEDEDLTVVISLNNCVWFVYGALMKQGSTLMPKADSTRLLFATWWIFITILTSFYTANLTAFLTLSRFTLPIEGPWDLTKTKASWVAHKGSSLEYLVQNRKEFEYLNKTVRDGRGRFLDNVTDNEMLKLVKNRKSSLLRERRMVEYWMFRDYLQKTEAEVPENERCTFVITPQNFLVHAIAFAYPKDSPLAKHFDPLFQALVETGIVKHLLRRDSPPTEICPLDLKSTERQLRNGDLFTTYLVVVFGFITSILFFIGEVVYTTVKRCSDGTKIEIPDGDWTGSVGFKKAQLFPPPYSVLMQQQPGLGKHQNINGRDYLVINSKTGDPQLIPVRSPSAFLFQYSA